MKKIALLLALTLVLSCCMLASCGGSDDATPAASSAASSEAAGESSATEAASSEAAAESSEVVEESSEAEPSEDASEPDAEISKDPDATPGDGSNLALNKPYEIAQLFQQGGADNNWGWVDGIDPTYPDEDGKTLTDGVLPADDAGYADPVWMGFHGNGPDHQALGYSWATVDLGESYAISKVVLYVGSKALGAGIAAPGSVTLLVSDDGESFTEVLAVVPTDNEEVSYDKVEMDCDVTGRYVQVRMTSASWMFVGELEVY